jgi:multidrug efflux pump subunit AcrA (membrane-fusion protein)
MMVRKYSLQLAALVMLLFAICRVVLAQQRPPKLEPPVPPARSPFGNGVAGAGIVEARSQNISIGTAIPGVVLKVFGPDKPGMTPWDALIGHTVKEGDPLFLVDNRQLNAQLESNKANLANAVAQLKKLQMQPRPEEVPPSEAAVAAAKATVDLQKDIADRNARLVPKSSVAEQDYRQSVLSTEVARKQHEQAVANLKLLKAGAWQYDKEIAAAAVKVAQALVQQTQTDLDRCVARAPCDGVVLQVNVRPGEYVGTPPSQALMVLGAIDKTVHIRVDIDEHDIPRFKPGAPARASLRGSPQVSYPIRFVRVEPYVIPKKSLTGDNTERVDVRVLQVIYALDVTDKPVFVGQQLDVFIEGASGSKGW